MWRLIPLNVLVTFPKPNYENPVKRGGEVYWVSGFFLIVATFCVVSRLWTRIIVRRYFGIDDLLVLLGYIFSVGVTVCVAVGQSSYGWDRHMWDVPMYMYSGSAKVVYFSRIAWGLAASLTRLSVMCLYYRLLKACDAPRHFFWVNHVVTGASIVMLFYYLFSGIFPCKPIDAYWSWPPRPHDVCFDDTLSFRVSAITNTFLEAVVATLPLIAVFKLRVRREQRWAVVGVLSLGYSVAIAGICRTIFIFKISYTYDMSWWAMPQWICSEVENDLALICACAAPLRPIVGRTIKRLKGMSELTPHFPRPKLSWISTSHVSSTTHATTYAQDHEAASEWLTAMSRTIDLEGIANDGFGYSVHICGPTKAERRQMAHRRFKENLAKQGIMTQKELQGERTATPPGIATKTEFSVVESEQQAGRGASVGWGYRPGHGLPTTFEGLTKADYVEDAQSDPWVTSVQLEDMPLRAIAERHNAESFNDSSESVCALPIMPTTSLSAPEAVHRTSAGHHHSLSKG